MQTRSTCIAILGSRGYLGRNYTARIKSLGVDFFPIYHSQSRSEINQLLESNRPNYIVNLAATDPFENSENSLIGNYLYPLEVLKSAKSVLKGSFKWIQVGSYWEMQVEAGRNTPYAVHKRRFRNIIPEMQDTSFFEATSLILPHLVCGGEDSNRLSYQLSNAKNNQAVLKLSSGTQFLPILHVLDAVDAIGLSLESHQNLCSAVPIYYERVIDYARLILGKDYNRLVEVDPNWKSVDSGFPRVVFPERVSGFVAKRSMELILKELRKGK
jgi:nucleoside-diphosphate-sugar epimerase